jgi:hypothetical protein
MADETGSHLSIAEVLGLLITEFPDVTISKIRILESQGLIEPERTPSGYRKFSRVDVERLREILRQQSGPDRKLMILPPVDDSTGAWCSSATPSRARPWSRGSRTTRKPVFGVPMPFRSWTRALTASRTSGPKRALIALSTREWAEPISDTSPSRISVC